MLTLTAYCHCTISHPPTVLHCPTHARSQAQSQSGGERESGLQCSSSQGSQRAQGLGYRKELSASHKHDSSCTDDTEGLGVALPGHPAANPPFYTVCC